MNPILRWMKAHRGLTIAGVIALVLGFLGLSVLSYANGLRNEGIQRETQLRAQYLSNQNYLSAFISGFYEQISVATAAGDALDEILLDAVKGRYDEGGFEVGSSIFTAIVEAYPEAGVAELMENWGKVQDYIVAQRAGYRNIQDKLLDMLREYDLWRQTGIFRHMFVSMLGFPSDTLVAQVGDTKLTGQDALDKMYQIVLTSEAVDAYEDGEMDPLEVPTSS